MIGSHRDGRGGRDGRGRNRGGRVRTIVLGRSIWPGYGYTYPVYPRYAYPTYGVYAWLAARRAREAAAARERELDEEMAHDNAIRLAYINWQRAIQANVDPDTLAKLKQNLDLLVYGGDTEAPADPTPTYGAYGYGFEG